MADDAVRVPRSVLLGMVRLAAEARDPRDGLAAVSKVLAELLWPDPVPRLASPGTAAAESDVPPPLEVAAVARRAGSSMRSVRRAAARGTLRGRMVDGRWRFAAADADEWMETYLSESVTGRRKPVDPIATERAKAEALSAEFVALHARADELTAHAEALRIRVEVALAQGDPLRAHQLSKEADQAVEDAAAARVKAREVLDERNPLSAFVALVEQREVQRQREREALVGDERTVELDRLHAALAAKVGAEIEWRRTHPGARRLPKHLRDVHLARGSSSVMSWSYIEACIPQMRQHVESLIGGRK